MPVRSAEEFPGAEHDPLAYPGARPDYSYVYYQNQVYKIRSSESTSEDLWVETESGEEKLDDFLLARSNAPMSKRHAVLAVGSNGCPGRLSEKYPPNSGVALPVLVGSLKDAAVVYSRQLVSYGALPATYLYQKDVVSRLSVTMRTDEQLARMDETERIGEVYDRIPVEGQFSVHGGPKVTGLTAYLDPNILSFNGKPVQLKLFTQKALDWPAMDEREVLALVLDQAGILPGKHIEERHKRLLADEKLRVNVVKFLSTRMSALTVDKRGQLSPSLS